MTASPGPSPSIRRLIPLLSVPIVASAAVVTYAALEPSRTLAVLACAAFAVIATLVAALVNRPYWRATAGSEAADALFHTQRRNTRIAALIYAWAAASFIGAYGLGGLTWQHGLQYAAAAALIAVGFLLYVRHMGRTMAPPPLALTLAHAIAVFVGLVFLIGSGKLATVKGDWAANYIFLFGGLALLGLAAIAIRTHLRLAAETRSGGPPADVQR